MNQTYEVLPAATREGTGLSAVFTNDSPTENPGAGAFIINVEDLDPGASLLAVIQRDDGAYVLASNPLDRPGVYSVVVGSGLAVERPSVSAPHAVLPDAFRVAYVVRDGSVRFGVQASVI